MRVLVQRVSRASVSIEGHMKARIGRGLMAFVGVSSGDGLEEAGWLADKVARLRVFDDEMGRMGLSVQDVEGSVLCISQFTLLGELNKGTRPNFKHAASAEQAERIYEHFLSCLKDFQVVVESGVFGAKMDVELVNDGPVTLLLEG